MERHCNIGLLVGTSLALLACSSPPPQPFDAKDIAGSIVVDNSVASGTAPVPSRPEGDQQLVSQCDRLEETTFDALLPLTGPVEPNLQTDQEWNQAFEAIEGVALTDTTLIRHREAYVRLLRDAAANRHPQRGVRFRDPLSQAARAERLAWRLYCKCRTTLHGVLDGETEQKCTEIDADRWPRPATPLRHPSLTNSQVDACNRLETELQNQKDMAPALRVFITWERKCCPMRGDTDTKWKHACKSWRP